MLTNVLVIQSGLNYTWFYCMAIIPSPPCERWDSFRLSLGRNTSRCCFLLLKESAETSTFQLFS